jgi:hypothetical protein
VDIGTGAEIGRGSARRSGALATTTVALVVTGIFIAIAISSRGGPVTRPGAPGGGGAAAPKQLVTAVAWVDGLAAGFILPSDVTSRLDTQDPELAKVVRASWSDLRSSGSQARLHQALGWIDGLAAGRIMRSDVTSRLGAQDPSMAKIVTATWADLGPIADRSV